jgi:hypothetical protein
MVFSTPCHMRTTQTTPDLLNLLNGCVFDIVSIIVSALRLATPWDAERRRNGGGV